jgi:hypothetical protein
MQFLPANLPTIFDGGLSTVNDGLNLQWNESFNDGLFARGVSERKGF